MTTAAVSMEQEIRLRAAQYLARAARVQTQWYDAAGNWTYHSLPAATREKFWGAFALYENDQSQLADAIVRKCETPQYGQVKFNIFDTNIAVALLVQHRDKMAADVREKLERLARDGFSFKPGNRQPDYQFHGYNDNMPAKATLGLVLGGELLGDEAAVDYGVWNLRQLRAQLIRNGTNSEFNSPTYSPLTIHAMAEIAQHAQRAEARELARKIEARLWLDLAARYHPGLGAAAGPYSRAYTSDTLGHLSIQASMLWFVLGDAARPSPMLLFEPDAGGLVLHHMNDVPFNIVQMCWIAAGHYHVPSLAREWFVGKRYPFTAIATSEQGDFGPDFPARVARLHTHLQKDYAVGSSTTSMCSGEQTMSYFVNYAQKSSVESFKDVGTVFAKIVVNDDVPGRVVKAHKDYSNSGEEDCLASRANTIALQQGASVLVLTHPQLSLGGVPVDEDCMRKSASPTSITQLSEMVIFPSHFAQAQEIIVGNEKRASWEGGVARGQWIACRRGRLLIAVRPMVYSRTLGEAAITLETHNRYQVIRTTWYRGEPRVFTRAELRNCFGGFVAEHASVDEFASLQAFVESLRGARFSDYYWLTRRVRYARPARGNEPALDVECSITPGSQLMRYATINGQPLQMTVASYPGVASNQLPLLDEPFQPTPAFFPWQDFKVEWGDWPFAIGDREL